ncbi:hypothetical protein V1478_010519 [Vespula squamosa]|uniref:Uncharacterized protein n=1 Tax=Vespula squamosa TaxID=30214 RepID=A0ABD2AI10_VESSQ
MFISFHALLKVSKEVSAAEQVEVDPTLRIISYNHDSGYERPTLVNALNTREVAQARCLQSFKWRGRPKLMLGFLYRFAQPLLVPTIVVKTIYKLTRKFMTSIFRQIVKESE